MRHRSVIAFIILAAALVAAPQVAHDFAALKSAVGARIRGEILRAFLSLHAGEGAGELKTRRAEAAPMLASCKAEAKTDEQAARAEQRRDEERAQAATRDEDRAEAATRADAAPQADAHRQLAMLIPPGLGFDVRYGGNAPRAAGLGAQDTRVDRERRSSAEERRRSDETRRRASSQEAHSEAVAAPRFETAALSRFEVSSKLQGEEVLKNLGPLVREAVWTRTAQSGMKVRVYKIRCKVGASPAGEPRPAPAAPPVGPPPVSIEVSTDE